MTMTRYLLPLLALPLLGALEVDPIYQSHMVLQQGKAVPVSGTATGNAPILVSYGYHKVEAL